MEKDNYIKHLKPRKNGRYHQGVIDPKEMKKYYSQCVSDPIIYRSGLELQFIQYCEQSSKVAKWASEPIEIPYYSKLKKKEARYYPDYVVENADGVRCIVEIKPKAQTKKPDAFASDWDKQTWIQNVDKWTAAKAFADAHGMKFVIISEDFFD